MPITFQQFKASNPAYANIPDDQLFNYVHQEYYSDMPTEEFAKAVDYVPVKPAEEDKGDFVRGFKEPFKQLPQQGYGLLAGAGAAAENTFGEGGYSTGLKKYAVGKYIDETNKLALDSKESDSLTYSLDKTKEGDYGSLVDWVQHTLGYGTGQLLELLATRGIGSAAARLGTPLVAKELTEKMVASQVAKLAAAEATKNLGQAELRKMAIANVGAKLAQIGGNAAMVGSSIGMEGSEIMGGLTQKEQETGKPLTGTDIAKGFAWSIASGLTDFAGDKFGLDIVTGKSPLFKAVGQATGLKGMIGRSLLAGGVAAPVEGGQEYVQTLMEEQGKGNNPFSAQSLRQAFDASGMGAIAGAGAGAIGGVVSKPEVPVVQPVTPPPEVLNSGSVDESITNAQQQVNQAGDNNAARVRSNAERTHVTTGEGGLADTGITGIEPKTGYDEIFNQAAVTHEIPVAILKAFNLVEAGGRLTDKGETIRPRDKNGKLLSNAVGPMQIIGHYFPQFDPEKLANDPQYNVNAAAQILQGYYADTPERLSDTQRWRLVARRYFGSTNMAKNTEYANKIIAAIGQDSGHKAALYQGQTLEQPEGTLNEKQTTTYEEPEQEAGQEGLLSNPENFDYLSSEGLPLKKIGDNIYQDHLGDEVEDDYATPASQSEIDKAINEIINRPLRDEEKQVETQTQEAGVGNNLFTGNIARGLTGIDDGGTSTIPDRLPESDKSTIEPNVSGPGGGLDALSTPTQNHDASIKGETVNAIDHTEPKQIRKDLDVAIQRMSKRAETSETAKKGRDNLIAISKGMDNGQSYDEAFYSVHGETPSESLKSLMSDIGKGIAGSHATHKNGSLADITPKKYAMETEAGKRIAAIIKEETTKAKNKEYAHLINETSKSQVAETETEIATEKPTSKGSLQDQPAKQVKESATVTNVESKPQVNETENQIEADPQTGKENLTVQTTTPPLQESVPSPASAPSAETKPKAEDFKTPGEYHAALLAYKQNNNITQTEDSKQLHELNGEIKKAQVYLAKKQAIGEKIFTIASAKTNAAFITKAENKLNDLIAKRDAIINKANTQPAAPKAVAVKSEQPKPVDKQPAATDKQNKKEPSSNEAENSNKEGRVDDIIPQQDDLTKRHAVIDTQLDDLKFYQLKALAKALNVKSRENQNLTERLKEEHPDDIEPALNAIKAEEPKVEEVKQEEPKPSNPLFNKNDINYDSAYRAYTGISMSPEKRAQQEQDGYVEHMQNVYDDVIKYAKTDAQKAIIEDAFTTYKDGYLKRTLALLGAKSRVMSPMITGPSNFPVARNLKANAVEHKRLEELLDFDKYGQEKLKAIALGSRSQEEKNDEVWNRLKKNIASSLSTIKGIDDGTERGYSRALFVSNLVGRIKTLSKNGETNLVNQALDFIENYQKDLKKPLITPKNSIWELRDTTNEAKEEVKKQLGIETLKTYNGASVVNNHELERVQILFDSKPNEETRTLLKQNAFKWSPNNNAWQRQNTTNGISVAKTVLDNLYTKPNIEEDTALFSKSATKQPGLTIAEATDMLPKRVKPMLASGTLKILRNIGEVSQEVLNRGEVLFHKAWHGSPHEHDKFDSSKIGTGEGAQAFGYGHYMSSSADIAKYYRDKLSGNTGVEPLLVGVVPPSGNKGISDITRSNIKNLAHELISDSGVTKLFSEHDVITRTRMLSNMINLLHDREILDSVVRLIPIDMVNMLSGQKFSSDMLLDNPSMFIDLLSFNPDNSVPGRIEAVNILAPVTTLAATEVNTGLSILPHVNTLKSIATKPADSHKLLHKITSKIPYPSKFVNKKGKLYQVELAPTQDEYLDWDKPLSEQSYFVKDALIKAHPGDINIKGAIEDKGNNPYTGKEFYLDDLAGRDFNGIHHSQKAASAYLHSLGIRGIRYKADHGKSEANNYVIFSDDDISITEKYSNGNEKAEGLYDAKNDTLYLFSDNLNKDNFNSVISHELLHRALATDAKLKSSYNKLSAALQARFNIASKGFGTDIEKAAYKRVITAKTELKDQQEEFAAYIVSEWQRNPKSLPAKIIKAIKDFISAIRISLLRAGLDLGMVGKLHPSDLLAMAGYGAQSNVNIDASFNNEATVMASAKDQGYKGDNPSEAFEWLRAVSKGLDMSQEGRMARAKDMGFEINTIYHHGSDAEINEFYMPYGGTYLAEASDLSSIYGDSTSKNHGVNKYFIKKGRHVDLRNENTESNKAFELLDEYFDDEKGYAGYEKLSAIIKDGMLIEMGRDFQNDVMDYLRYKGYDSVTFYDFQTGDFDIDISTVVFKPNQIRSIHAAFDPDFANIGNLLASTNASDTWTGGDTITIDGKERATRNSNGQLIAQTEEGLRNFYTWFKDSKVVDDKGRPLVIYHGANYPDFTKFETNGADYTKTEGTGAFFTDNKDAANSYTDPDYPGATPFNYQVYLKLDHPRIINFDGDNWNDHKGKSSDDYARAARLSGKWDGVIFKNINDAGPSDYDIKANTYVAFSPNQIKSAIGNTGDFSTDNNDIRYSIANEEETNLPDETGVDKFQRQFQDKRIRFKVIQQAKEIEAAKDEGYSGNDIHEARAYMKAHGIVNPIRDDTDVYQAESLRSGIATELIKDFEETVLKPLVKETVSSKLTMDDIANFLIMQHVEEANARIRKIKPDQDNPIAYGRTDDEAKAYLDEVKQRDDYQELKRISDKWRGLTEDILNMKVSNGILPKEQADAYRATFNFYVPVKGAEETPQGTGRGLSVYNNNKRRLGHGLRDERVVENIIKDYESTINLIEKNKVAKIAGNFIKEINDEDIGTIGKPVRRQVFMPGAMHYMVEYHGSDVHAFDNLHDAQQFVNDESVKAGRNKRDFYIDHTRDDGRVILQVKPLLDEHEFQYYEDGKAIRGQWNDELLARAFKNLGIEPVNKVLEGAREFNTFLSKAYTGWSPTFLIKNPIRDAIQGAITLTSKLGIKETSKIFSAYPHAMKELYSHFKNHGSSGEVNLYRGSGGSTGAAYISDTERLGNDIMDSYNEYAGAVDTYNRIYEQAIANGDSESKAKLKAAMKAGKAGFRETPILGHFINFMEKANSITENALRLATFNTLIAERENGKRVYTNAQAALIAKDLMNFNRKGELTTQLGALYLFFNPNAQGTHVLLSALGNSKYKNEARVLTGTIVLAAYLAAEAMRSGDDEDKWKRIPANLKDRNLIFGVGDTKFMLPVPYGYGIFHSLGNAISDVAHGQNGWKSGIRLMASLFDNFSPFGNPIDSEHGAFQLLPTVPKMALATSVNENNFGSPIMPDKWNASKPDSQTMWRNTKGTVYDDVTQMLNNISGGSKYKAGLVDVSPETLRFWVSSLTGGTGQFAMDSINLGATALQGATPDLKEIPIVKAFTHEIGVQDARQAFWKAADEAKTAADEFSAAKKANDRKAMTDIQKSDGALIALSKYAVKQQKMIKSLRDAQDSIRTSGLSLAAKKAKLKVLERKETEVYDKFLQSFYKENY